MKQDTEELPVVVAQGGPLNGERWIIRSMLTMGRDPECQVVIPDRQVSRYHARLSVTENGIRLEDLGSKNGTHLNGNAIDDEVVLQDGDVVQIALVQKFIYYSSDATVPLDVKSDLSVSGEGIPHRLRLESRQRRVWIGKKEVIPALSAPQFTLLEIIYQQDGQVVSRQEVIERIWGGESLVGISDQALDALVRRLRDRLAAIDPTHTYIVTLRGHGIRLDNPPD